MSILQALFNVILGAVGAVVGLVMLLFSVVTHTVSSSVHSVQHSDYIQEDENHWITTAQPTDDGRLMLPVNAINVVDNHKYVCLVIAKDNDSLFGDTDNWHSKIKFSPKEITTTGESWKDTHTEYGNLIVVNGLTPKDEIVVKFRDEQGNYLYQYNCDMSQTESN